MRFMRLGGSIGGVCELLDSGSEGHAFEPHRRTICFQSLRPHHRGHLLRDRPLSGPKWVLFRFLLSQPGVVATPSKKALVLDVSANVPFFDKM